MIRVFVVDEVPLVGDVVAAVLRSEDDLVVVGHGTCAEDVLGHLHECDVVLLSASLPGGATFDLLRRMSATAPEVKVLVTGVADSAMLILKLVESGAAGYVLRDDSAEDMPRRIRAAHQNRAVVSPELAFSLMRRLTRLSEERRRLTVDEAAIDELTPREREVLRLLHLGLSNQAIADELTIEVGTVKNHVHNILAKLNVNSRHDAAVVHGLLADSPGRLAEAFDVGTSRNGTAA